MNNSLDSGANMPEMQIRHGLAAALGQLSEAVQQLLVLLEQQGLALQPEQLPEYNNLLLNIALAAETGAAWVGKSEDLDQTAALTPKFGPNAWVQ